MTHNRTTRFQTSPNQFPEFRPHRLLVGGHAQTLAGYYLRPSTGDYRATQHVVELDHDDALVLHDDCPSGWQPGDRVVLLVPGVDGSYESPFIPRVAAKLNDRGFRTFCMDHRGSGPRFQLAEHLGHAGRSEDTAAAVHRISQLCPASAISGVGFSMGGNMLLKMLGEHGSAPVGNLDSCLAIAPPIDILPCAEYIERPWNRWYSRSFAKSLVKHVERRREYVEAMRHVSLEPPPRSLWEFDDRVTAPLSGFRDAPDYYNTSSSKHVLPHVAVPTVIIAADDDPMIPVQIFEAAEYSNCTELIVTNSGGHLGFFGVSGVDPDRRWMDWRIVDWVTWHDENP